MRKFVRKNRQKRKYTRKTEQVPSFSFAKTAYSLLPLLIMIVAFMTTVVISAPLREQITHIQISFNMPEFSLSTPLNSLQAFAILVLEGFLALWNACVTISVIFAQSLGVIGSATLHLLTFVGNLLQTIGQTILQTMSLIVQVITVAGQIIVADMLMTMQTLITIIASIWSAAVFIITTVLRTIVEIGSAIVHFVVVIGQTIGMWVLSVIISVARAIGSAVQAIVHVIEIPFKVLAAFWEQIKPYVMILGKHIQMSGNDLANGFASWDKVASLVTSPK